MRNSFMDPRQFLALPTRYNFEIDGRIRRLAEKAGVDEKYVKDFYCALDTEAHKRLRQMAEEG